MQTLRRKNSFLKVVLGEEGEEDKRNLETAVISFQRKDHQRVMTSRTKWTTQSDDQSRRRTAIDLQSSLINHYITLHSDMGGSTRYGRSPWVTGSTAAAHFRRHSYTVQQSLLKKENKKLSCRREAEHCFVSLNISLKHSRSLKLVYHCKASVRFPIRLP